jgi:hypothetical protein
MLASFGVGQVLESIIWFFLFLIWLMLLFHVLLDIFRSPDLGGGAKALWLAFVLVLPFLGVLAYVVIRGAKMHEHDTRAFQQNDAAMREYLRSVVGTGSPADELTKLADLRERGIIDDAEFARLKDRIVN